MKKMIRSMHIVFAAMVVVRAAAAQPDSILSVADSNSAQSEAERMYRNASQSMRRDMPATPVSGSDTQSVRQKKQEETQAAEPAPQQPKKDSYLVIPASVSRTTSGHPAQIKKRGVHMILGACALVGGGVVLYLANHSKDRAATEINNRIPPPPDPPPSHIER